MERTREKMRMHPLWMALVALAMLPTGGCKEEEAIPDGEWNVTVTGISTDCVDSLEGYEEKFTYQLFYDGSATQINIDGEGYANGTTSGCSLTYESAVWGEPNAEGGPFQWQITGQAIVQGAAGGCDLEEGVDWLGTETLTVTESENEGVPEGCEYEMEVIGSLAGG